MITVAALYVQPRSVYHSLPGVDCWDAGRDARLYPGPFPVVAHPPCRAWGRYKHRSKHPAGEPDLAFAALAAVRRYGGVLEHPYGSTFFAAAGIPRSQLVLVNQVDWGHRALKPTYLYVVGCGDLPQLPPAGVPTSTVENMWRGEREATPPLFAQFLLEIARRSNLS